MNQMFGLNAGDDAHDARDKSMAISMLTARSERVSEVLPSDVQEVSCR